MDGSQSTHRRAPAVTRAVAVLRRLGALAAPVGVNPLARDLGLVPSTCLHILRVLVEEGLVDFDPATKRYQIGVGILPIARNAIQRNSFATLATPALEDLSSRFGVTAVATQLLELQQMVVVAISQARLPYRLSAELGSRFPALISATGRCVAAYSGLDEAALRERFERLKWANPPSFETWRGQVDQARAAGYGVDAGDYIAGVTIVAAPFFDGEGRATRSLVVIGISEALANVGVPEIAAEMLRLRDEIAERLL